MPTMKRQSTRSFDEVLEAAPAILEEEGFGILTEIDMTATLKEKLDVDFRRYRILGACNPALAHKALGTDLDVGVMLPCNVLVYEDDDGNTVVSVMDPVAAIGAFGDHPTLREVAADAKARLERVLEKLG